MKKNKWKNKNQVLSGLGGALNVIRGAMLEEVNPPGLVVDLGHVTPTTVTSPLASPSQGCLAPDKHTRNGQ